MEKHLIVVEPFGSYAKGDRITDAKAIADILASENASSVVPIMASEPQPALAIETKAAE